jgi:hypothetical protein
MVGFQMVDRKRSTEESIQYSFARVSRTWVVVKPWANRVSITDLSDAVMV